MALAPRSTHASLLCVLTLAVALAACSDEPSADGDTDDATTSDDVTAAGDVSADAVDDDAEQADTKVYEGKCAGGPGLCDDLNPCTIDDCDPSLGCVHEVKVCDDDDECTKDTCDVNSGACTHDPEDCDDGNACTTGSCSPGEGCSWGPLDCDDGDACTTDGCLPAKGCNNQPRVCDDGVTCTLDGCDPANGCTHEPPVDAVCCELTADCDDGNVCTVNTCTDAGICETQGVFGCCAADADCDDGNPCTTESCTVATGQCVVSPASGPGCCQTASQCNDGDSCTVDICHNGQCASESVCCSSQAQCADTLDAGTCGTALCTGDGCAYEAGSTPSCCDPQPLGTGFEAGETPAVTVTPASNGVWFVDDAANVATGTAAEGTGSLRWSPTSDLPGGKAVAVAMLDEIELPLGSKPTLTFAWWATLGSAAATEGLRVRVHTDLGSWLVWQAPWDSTMTAGQFATASVDLRAFAGRPGSRRVKIAFELQAIAPATAAGAVVIDSLAVAIACGANTCMADADCADGLGATFELCAGKDPNTGQGSCLYVTHKDYCEDNGDCNDGNGCTAEVCNDSFGCDYTMLPDCCTKTAECDDDDPCTTDKCSGLKCSHTELPGSVCCNDVADCDDGNPCTTDLCDVVGLPCQHTKTDPGCCVGASECDDGDGCTLDSCQANDCVHLPQCCTADADCDDGDDLCTADSCDVGVGLCTFAKTQAEGCCEPVFLDNGFEASAPLEGWVVTNSSTASKWQVVTGKQAKTGNAALYYGNPGKGSFDDGSTSGTVGLPLLELPSGESLVLTLALWMDTESGTTFDKFEVWVVQGVQEFKVWDKSKPGFSTMTWVDVEADLSAFAGKTVQLELRFDTTDSVANSGAGVYVDDVRLTRGCDPLTCNADADCDDGHLFSTESCAAGSCAFVVQ